MRGEVLVGPERRRRWSEDEKARIIAESLQLGVQVAEIARRHGVSRGLLYTWRRAARYASASPVVWPEPAFVPVLLSAPAEPQTAAAASEMTDPDRASRRSPKRRTTNGGEIEVVLPGGCSYSVAVEWWLEDIEQTLPTVLTLRDKGDYRDV